MAAASVTPARTSCTQRCVAITTAHQPSSRSVLGGASRRPALFAALAESPRRRKGCARPQAKPRLSPMHAAANGRPGPDESDFHGDRPARTRFRARVAYLGTLFRGWQLQSVGPTVQGELEATLARRFRRRVPVLGAGRTDAGVHARGQAVHFDLLSTELPVVPPAPANDEGGGPADFCRDLQNSMNRMLPLDIRIFNLQVAPRVRSPVGAAGSGGVEVASKDESKCAPSESSSPLAGTRPWHAIQSAKSKWYSYRLALGPTLWNPVDRFTRTHFLHRPSFASSRPDGGGPYALTKGDIDRLGDILRLFEGTHDFKAFSGQLEQNEKRAGRAIDTVRTVHRVELVREPLMEDYAFGNEADGASPPPRDHLGFVGEEGYYRIDFLLQGALYKMVRNMVGTAMEVWLGRMPEEKLVRLLGAHGKGDAADGKDGGRGFGRKDNPCKPAPPEGLTLECVYYDDGF